MQEIEKILSFSPKEILDEIEFKISTKIEQIISELLDGRTDFLKKMSYIICGDPTDMKVYEIESFLLKNEFSRLKNYQLAALWLDIEGNAEHYPIGDNYDFIDELDIFNDIYSKIDFYGTSGHTQEDFLKLLNRQCWLETKIQESNLFYSELEDEVLSQIEYFDALSISVPDFVTSFEEIQFYYIYGKDVESLTFDEYKRHLLYKLAYLISKKNINEDFFSDVTCHIERFDYFFESSEFYKHLPAIFFAKKIIESEEFLFSLGEFTALVVNFTNLDSNKNIEVLQDYDENLSDAINGVIETDILDVINIRSDAYNKLVCDTSEQRYDHDLSRFLQYTYTLEQRTDEESRLFIYNRLKEELKDEHNTVRSSIETFLRDNFSEYERIEDIQKEPESIIGVKEDAKKVSISDNFFFFPIFNYIKNNIKTILQYSIWILAIFWFITYYIHENDIYNIKLKADEFKEQKIEQDINTSVQQSIVKFNADIDWIAKLNKGNSHYINSPIFTHELERVWLTEKPILFTGIISDIKIKNENEYTIIISRDFSANKTNFITDIELAVTASKNEIDSLIKTHDFISEYSFDKGVAVIAKLNSVTTQYLLDKDNEKYEVKTGNGRMLDIQFVGHYTDMLDN